MKYDDTSLPDNYDAGRGHPERVLRPGGHVCVRNSTAVQVPHLAYTEFFHDVVAATRGVAPARTDIIAAFADAGASLKASALIETELAADWPAYVERLSWRADSYLARLSDQAFAEGLEAMRVKYPPGTGPVLDEIEMFVFEKPL